MVPLVTSEVAEHVSGPVVLYCVPVTITVGACFAPLCLGCATCLLLLAVLLGRFKSAATSLFPDTVL